MVYYTTFFEICSCFYNIPKIESGKVILTKFQAKRLQLIILEISKNFESNFWETLEYEREIMGWIWCHNIDPVY